VGGVVVRVVGKVAVVGAATILFSGIGGPIGMTAGGGGDSAAAEGDLTRAVAVALAETGGGRVTGAEIGDAGSYYAIEVTLPDGRQVDVQLDESFAVVRTSPDVARSDAE
jgi:hypothetical protein